jgi:hypothetical protein
VPDPLFGHLTHQVVQGVLGLADVYVGRHHVGDQDVQCPGTVAQLADDVALGHDAGDVPAVVADDQSTHVVLGKRLDQLGDGGLGPDGGDGGAALGLEDVLDPHNCLLLLSWPANADYAARARHGQATAG